jgi:hypothetical protein
MCVAGSKHATKGQKEEGDLRFDFVRCHVDLLLADCSCVECGGHTVQLAGCEVKVSFS